MEEAPPSPTVGSNPWRPALRQLSNDLLPVTTASRVVSTPMGMAKLENPLQVVSALWLRGCLFRMCIAGANKVEGTISFYELMLKNQ